MPQLALSYQRSILSNNAAGARQTNHVPGTAGLDHIADSNLLPLAVPITHNDPVEVNRISSGGELFSGWRELSLKLRSWIIFKDF